MLWTWSNVFPGCGSSSDPNCQRPVHGLTQLRCPPTSRCTIALLLQGDGRAGRQTLVCLLSSYRRKGTANVRGCETHRSRIGGARAGVRGNGSQNVRLALASKFEGLCAHCDSCTSDANKWRTRMESRMPPVCKILLPRWHRAPRFPCVLAGHKTSAPCVIDAYVALLSWLLVLVVFFPIGSSAWQCFV